MSEWVRLVTVICSVGAAFTIAVTGFTFTLLVYHSRIPRLALNPTAAQLQIAYQPAQFRSTDGVTLAGWVLPGRPDSPWIIGCHGLGTNRSDILGIGQALQQAGYTVVVFDFRGHGESGGSATSFGLWEQRDLAGVLQAVQPRAGQRPIGLFGLSMGGAVALQVASRHQEIAAIAVDSVYLSLRRSMSHHVQYLYGIPGWLVDPWLQLAYALRFGGWAGGVDSAAALGRLGPRQAVFLVNGDQDPRVPVTDAQALYQAAHEPKELWLVPGGLHLETGYQASQQAYLERFVRFFQARLK